MAPVRLQDIVQSCRDSDEESYSWLGNRMIQIRAIAVQASLALGLLAETWLS
jgi:hypothetical protein